MKIADSLWETDWHDCSKKVKRSINFVIMRSQKPLKLTVGEFYTMSIQTALTVNNRDGPQLRNNRKLSFADSSRDLLLCRIVASSDEPKLIDFP